MELYWKTIGGILVACVLALSLGKREGDLALVLTMAVCAMAAVTALTFLEPVLAFFHRLEALGQLQSGALGILLKILGMGLVTQLAAMICRDAGNSSLAGAAELLGTALMLKLSLPLLETLLELVMGILGEV